MMFYFRLARELGMTVGQLLREADSKELAGWMEFLSIEVEQQEEKKKELETKKAEQSLRAQLTQAGQAAARKKKKRR